MLNIRPSCVLQLVNLCPVLCETLYRWVSGLATGQFRDSLFVGSVLSWPCLLVPSVFVVSDLSLHLESAIQGYF